MARQPESMLLCLRTSICASVLTREKKKKPREDDRANERERIKGWKMSFQLTHFNRLSRLLREKERGT